MSPAIKDRRTTAVVDYADASDQKVLTLGARALLRALASEPAGDDTCLTGPPCPEAKVTEARLNRVSLQVPSCDTSHYRPHLLETDAPIGVWVTATPTDQECAAPPRVEETFTLRAPIGDRPVVALGAGYCRRPTGCRSRAGREPTYPSGAKPSPRPRTRSVRVHPISGCTGHS